MDFGGSMPTNLVETTPSAYAYPLLIKQLLLTPLATPIIAAAAGLAPLLYVAERRRRLVAPYRGMPDADAWYIYD